MALKVKRAGSAEYGQYIKAMVAADPGAGKTRTGSTWPNPLYANIEGGLMSVADRAPLYVDIETTGELEELRRVLRQPPSVREQEFGDPVDTIIIDTFDELAKIFIAQRLASEGKETLAQADWGWLGDQLRGVLRGFRNLDMHVVINVHLKSKTDEETGSIFYQPAIQGAVGEEIAQFFDLAVLLRTKIENVPSKTNPQKVERVTRRYLQTYQDLRHPWVKDRSGRLPNEFEINFEDDFARLHDLIYTNAPKGGGEVATIAAAAPTPPPVAEPPTPTSVERSNPNQPTLEEGSVEMVDSKTAKKEILTELGVEDGDGKKASAEQKDLAKKVWGTRGTKPVSRPDLDSLKAEARLVSGAENVTPQADETVENDTPEASETTEAPAPAADPLPQGETAENIGDQPAEDPPAEAPPAPADEPEAPVESNDVQEPATDAEAPVEAPEKPDEPAENPLAVTSEPPEGFKHMAGCPNHKDFCEFDQEVTPLADLRWGKELCRECYVEGRNAED